MMGAGFGGCTINLIDSDSVDAVVEEVKKKYKEKYSRDLKVYIASIANGTEEIVAPKEVGV